MHPLLFRCLCVFPALLLAACGGGSSQSAAPTLSFTASALSGGSSTLTWSSSGATGCTASGAWSGTKGTSGSESVSPSATSDYTLACTGSGGTASHTVTVTVASGAPTVSIVANPGTISAGSSSQLTWSSTNATSCTASGAWSGSEPTSGTQAVTPTANASYSLTCSGSGGSASATASVTIASGAAPTLTFTATPASIAAGGSSTLAWSTTNATSCMASGAWSGTQATSGSVVVSPTANSTYTLACTGAGGTVTRSAAVTLQTSGVTADSASKLGAYTVATYTSGIAGGADYKIPKIWYPTNGTPPYASAIFIPGLNSSYTEAPYTVQINGKTVVEADITQWGTFLASHGFVVMFIDTNTAGIESQDTRRKALQEAANALAAENTRSGSPLNGKLMADKIAVMGHSFGGAGALLAANDGSNAHIVAALGLSPVPVAGTGYPNDALPSMILSGVGDPYTPNFQGQYNSIPATTTKAWANFANLTGIEFESMHAIALVPLGTHSTDPLVARLGLSFLEVYLYGDTRYQAFIANDPALANFAYANP